jgi:hypothetical protein
MFLNLLRKLAAGYVRLGMTSLVLSKWVVEVEGDAIFSIRRSKERELYRLFARSLVEDSKGSIWRLLRFWM